MAARPLAVTSLRSCASLRSQLPSEAELLRRILRAQLRDSEAARSETETKAVDLERERAKLADALAYPLKKRASLLKVAEGRAARKEVERLKGECGRLRGEARKAAETASARDAAHQSTRERRAAILMFYGPVTVYSHLQACGIINDHGRDCPRYAVVNAATVTVRKRRDREKGVVDFS